MISYKSRDFHCPIEFSISIIDGKWKSRIIWYLKNRSRRFGELKKLLSDTSKKVLVQQLRELEMDGIVERKVFAQVPPKVEYYLTEQGKALIPVFEQLKSWGLKHIEVHDTNLIEA